MSKHMQFTEVGDIEPGFLYERGDGEMTYVAHVEKAGGLVKLYLTDGSNVTYPASWKIRSQNILVDIH